MKISTKAENGDSISQEQDLAHGPYEPAHLSCDSYALRIVIHCTIIVLQIPRLRITTTFMCNACLSPPCRKDDTGLLSPSQD